VDGERFGENLANGHAGVERGIGILKDDGEMAAEAAEIAWWEREEIDGFVRRGVVEDFAGGGFEQAEENARKGGFAAAGFADEAERPRVWPRCRVRETSSRMRLGPMSLVRCWTERSIRQ
jgi:hypothetical protein